MKSRSFHLDRYNDLYFTRIRLPSAHLPFPAPVSVPADGLHVPFIGTYNVPMPSQKTRRTTFFFFTALALIQALLAIAAFTRIPSETANNILFGFSRERLLLISVPFGLICAFLILAAAAWRMPDRFDQALNTIAHRLKTPAVMRRLVFWLLALSTFLLILDLFTTWEAVLTRMQPLLRLGVGLALETLVFAPILARGVPRTTLAAGRWLRQPVRAGILTVFLVSAALFSGAIRWIRTLGSDDIGWNTTGTPILEVQLLLLLLLMGSLILVSRFWKRAHLPVPPNALIFILLWAGAGLYWSSMPLQPSWYLAAPHSPNFDYYPTSDALIYDLTAQNMLVGEELRSRAFDDIPVRRPLFTFFLGILHAAAGPEIDAVSALQATLLGVLPALVFLVVARLSGRFAGLAAALLIVIREGNAIAFSDSITVAHSRLFMSDLPTAIGVALFLLLALPWVQAPETTQKKRWLVLGSVLGALLLIRFETVLLLPIAAGTALLTAPRRPKNLLPGLIWISIGTLLFLLPWISRNYARTGEIFIEVPGNRTTFLIQRLFREAESSESPPPKVAPRFFAQEETAVNPGARILSHYLHSNVQSILIFPSTFRPGDAAVGFALNREPDRFWNACCSGTDYIRRLPFWQWYKWDLEFPQETLLPIAFNLLALSTGLVLAWKKMGAAGVMPFAAGQAHYLINAVARTSGGRYLLPVDWIWVGYYAIGLTAIFLWVLRLLKPLPGWKTLDPAEPPASKQAGKPALLATAAAILLTGALLPAGEHLFPKIYPDMPPQAWVARAAAEADLETLSGHPNGAILHGRGLYTRYFSPGEGDPGSTFPNLYPQPYPRVVLFIAGPTSSGIVLPVEMLPDIALESGQDVLAAGCRIDHPKQTYLDAYLVYFPAEDLLLVRSNLPGDLTCPPPPVDEDLSPR